MIWFALPAAPQPGVNAATWVAQSPLVAFLELQAVLLLQLVLVVGEALVGDGEAGLAGGGLAAGALGPADGQLHVALGRDSTVKKVPQ